MKLTDHHPQFDTIKADFEAAFMSLAGQRGIDDATCYEVLFQLAASIVAGTGDKPMFVAIAGSQGSGKTTFAELLKFTFSQCFAHTAAVLSLDDFYLPRKERLALADSIHPLLAVRGVPGTHDVAWLASAIQQLAAGQACEVPLFDKASDDRLATTRSLAPPDIVILEGWCWGASPQPEAALLQPVNTLEQTRDKDGVWRRYVNGRLAQEYRQIFGYPVDVQVDIKAPSMDAVYRWRLQQEQQLLNSKTSEAANHVMDEQAIREFIAHYERITLWMLAEMPHRADLVIELDESHHISRVRM